MGIQCQECNQGFVEDRGEVALPQEEDHDAPEEELKVNEVSESRPGDSQQ